MARYAYACAEHHETVATFPMGEAASRITCERCGRLAARIYGFHFVEDRTRFFRNPVDGTSFSYSLGVQMPDNRADYHRLLAAKGCEPVTPGTMPEQWKENQAYREHVTSGGDRDAAFEQPQPATCGKTVLQQLRESDVRIPS
jgi:hypothetical protein